MHDACILCVWVVFCAQSRVCSGGVQVRLQVSFLKKTGKIGAHLLDLLSRFPFIYTHKLPMVSHLFVVRTAVVTTYFITMYVEFCLRTPKFCTHQYFFVTTS